MTSGNVPTLGRNEEASQQQINTSYLSFSPFLRKVLESNTLGQRTIRGNRKPLTAGMTDNAVSITPETCEAVP